MTPSERKKRIALARALLDASRMVEREEALKRARFYEAFGYYTYEDMQDAELPLIDPLYCRGI